MFADVGNVPAVISKDGYGGRDSSFGYGWIFALVLIFLALVFLWGRNDRRDHRYGGTDIAATVAPLAAAKMMEDKGGYRYNNNGWDWNESHREHWDILRDQGAENRALQKEVLENKYALSKEVLENKWVLTREMDQNHFKTQEQICGVKTEIAAAERRILDRIDADRYDRVRDERDKYREEAANLRFHAPWKQGPFCPPIGPDLAYVG